MTRVRWCAVLLLWAMWAMWVMWAMSGAAHATESATDCRLQTDDVKRLACYDRTMGAPVAPRAPSALSAKLKEPKEPPESTSATSALTDLLSPIFPTTTAATGAPTLLSRAWELDPATKTGTFHLLPHEVNYVLPARYSSNPTGRPSSPTRGDGLDVANPIDTTETKFQLSLKLKAFENLFGNNGDVWFGYTQQSHWQVYSGDLSRPFRETDHSPEVILSLRTNAEMFGWRWRLLNLGLIHQSNGRSESRSRSWNRVYAQFGLERDNWTVVARPWLRLPERGVDDDNPDIRQTMGSGDLRVGYTASGHVYSALGRYSVSGGRGALQLDWAFPLSKALRGYVQLTTGYGESLIDYNHSQSTLGVGILLLPWK